MGFILYLFSSIARLILVPAGMIYGFVKDCYHHHFDVAVKNLNARYFRIAKARDEYGNMVCRELFNRFLLKKESKHLFGKDGETISQVLAANYADGTLTGLGVFVAKYLIKAKDTAFIKQP